jgi:hypothetical protein
VEGNYLALSNEEKGKASLARALNITNAKVLDAGYREFRDQSPRNAEVSRDGAERNVRLVAPPGASARVEDYVDFSFNEELRREGFFDAMEGKYGKR